MEAASLPVFRFFFLAATLNIFSILVEEEVGFQGGGGAMRRGVSD